MRGVGRAGSGISLIRGAASATGAFPAGVAPDAGVREDEDGFSDWIDVERLAVTLRTWEPLVMPGLLQTGLYARAISEVWQAVDGDFDPDRYAAERLKRQEIFDRQPPPSFGAVIAESVLHTPVGGPPVMRGQLKHLLEMSQHPRVSIQVLPTDIGAHVGMLGSFITAMLPDSTTGIVYQQMSTGQYRIIGNVDEYARVGRIFDALRTDALSARASRAKMESVMEERWPE